LFGACGALPQPQPGALLLDPRLYQSFNTANQKVVDGHNSTVDYGIIIIVII